MSAESALSCIVYKSDATVFMDSSKLESIIREAIERNKDLNVTGVLLSDGLQFIQYLEGPRKSLQALYTLIVKSSAHTNVTVLVDNPIKQREFPKWFMGLLRPSQSDLLNVMNWDWWDNINDHPWDGSNNRGIQKLIQFCDQMGVEPTGSYEM